MYTCTNPNCADYRLSRPVSELPMDVRYVEEGDLVECPTCESACIVREE